MGVTKLELLHRGRDRRRCTSADRFLENLQRACAKSLVEPVVLCCELGWYVLVTILLRTIEVNTTFNGFNLLHEAVNGGHAGTVYLILQQEGIDANSRDPFGNAPLHVAVRRGEEEICRLLLAHDNTDASASDSHGCTPLHLAFQCSQGGMDELEMVGMQETLLRSSKVLVNATNENGLSPLHIAVACNIWVWNAAPMLMSFSSLDTSVLDEKGFAPIHVAAHNAQTYAMHLLLKHHTVNFNIKTQAGHPVLSWAVHNLSWPGRLIRDDLESEGTPSYLESEGNHSDLESEETHDWPPPLSLIFLQGSKTCHYGHLNELRWTAFSEVGNDIFALVEMLVNHSGLDLNAVDRYGYTALDWARFYSTIHEDAIESVQAISFRMWIQKKGQSAQEANATRNLARQVVRALQQAGAVSRETPSIAAFQSIDVERAELTGRLASTLFYDCADKAGCHCKTLSGQKLWG